ATVSVNKEKAKIGESITMTVNTTYLGQPDASTPVKVTPVSATNRQNQSETPTAKVNGSDSATVNTNAAGNATFTLTDPNGKGVKTTFEATIQSHGYGSKQATFTTLTSPDVSTANFWGHMKEKIQAGNTMITRPFLIAERKSEGYNQAVLEHGERWLTLTNGEINKQCLPRTGASKDQLTTLYTEHENGLVNLQHGWPIGEVYATTTEQSMVDLSNGSINTGSTTRGYVTCSTYTTEIQIPSAVTAQQETTVNLDGRIIVDGKPVSDVPYTISTVGNITLQGSNAGVSAHDGSFRVAVRASTDTGIQNAVTITTKENPASAVVTAQTEVEITAPTVASHFCFTAESTIGTETITPIYLDEPVTGVTPGTSPNTTPPWQPFTVTRSGPDTGLQELGHYLGASDHCEGKKVKASSAFAVGLVEAYMTRSYTDTLVGPWDGLGMVNYQPPMTFTNLKTPLVRTDDRCNELGPQASGDCVGIRAGFLDLVMYRSSGNIKSSEAACNTAVPPMPYHQVEGLWYYSEWQQTNSNVGRTRYAGEHRWSRHSGWALKQPYYIAAWGYEGLSDQPLGVDYETRQCITSGTKVGFAFSKTANLERAPVYASDGSSSTASLGSIFSSNADNAFYDSPIDKKVRSAANDSMNLGTTYGASGRIRRLSAGNPAPTNFERARIGIFIDTGSTASGQ
ncbi:hypothetical protein K6327_004473, partial [Vibrio vulnificus]|nr:hypothetical protein [Vibrio vulnificus]